MKILVIDDNAFERQALKSIIEKEGHEVVYAKDGQEGLEKAKTHAPDLIITDILMPNVAGFQFLRTIKKNERLRQIPVIVYSVVYEGNEDRELAFALGAATYIAKPDNMHTLWESVKSQMNTIKAKKAVTESNLVDNDEIFFMNYGHVVAIRLETKVKELEQEVERYKQTNEEICLLQSISIAVGTSKNLRDATIVAIKKICDFTGWVYGEVWMPNPDETLLERNHRFYSNRDNCELFTKRSAEITFPPGVGLPGRAWSAKQPVWIEDVTLDQNYLRASVAKEAGLKTRVAFPIITENKVICIVVFYHKMVKKRDERLEKIILAALSHIGPIIKQKQVEDSLRRNEARLVASQRIAHLGSWERDILKNKVWWSDETYRIFGLKPGKCEATYESFLDAVHPDDREFIRESENKALKGESPCNIEYRLVRPDGTVRIVHTYGEVIRDSSGKPIQMHGMIQDITERKRIEVEQEILKEQLFRSQNLASVGLLAGGIAHHFNNLLMVIMGYASILQQKIEKYDALSEYVQKIIKSSELAAHLVQGLLAFSRKQPSSPKRVNLNEIIGETKSLLLKFVRENIVLKTTLTEKDCIVMADTGQLEQILMNLATNASDAMPEGGNLTISTDIITMNDAFRRTHGYGKTGRYVLMSFSDTGVGMDENTKIRIFEPFFTTKEVGKGTGLGLASVYGIVKQYHGYIDVDSTPGKGTSFRIYLPLIESNDSGEKAGTVPMLKGGTETILIAEDEEEVRDLVKMLLETSGYKSAFYERIW